MENIKIGLKIFLTDLVENAMKLFWVAPLKKNSILFISYTGNYSDSPKYIYRELKKRKMPYKYTWAVNTGSMYEREISNCKKVVFGTLSYYLAICTSQIVITNNFLNTYVPRRPGQQIINTWHGGSPLKTVGMVNDEISEFDKYFYKKHRNKYSIFISSSEFMTKEVFRKSFTYKGKVFNCGLPRNALLFRNVEKSKKKVSEYFNVPIDDKHGIILYAPTFRGGATNAGFISIDIQFNIQKCIETAEKRFGKNYTFLFRSHYFNNNIPKGCLIATDYPDMQELLAASDIMITDYSSCMGDMCLMYKPVFLYVPDLEEYISDRGFYWDIYSLPFPVSKNEDLFYDSIMEFDEENYSEKVDNYLKRLGSYEGPDSDKKFVDYLCKLMKKDKLYEQ